MLHVLDALSPHSEVPTILSVQCPSRRKIGLDWICDTSWGDLGPVVKKGPFLNGPKNSPFWENSPFSLTWNGLFSRTHTIDQNGLFFTTGPCTLALLRARRKSEPHFPQLVMARPFSCSLIEPGCGSDELSFVSTFPFQLGMVVYRTFWAYNVYTVNTP